MFLIIGYVILFALIKKEIKENTIDEKRIFIFCAVVTCSLAIPYRIFFVSVGYKYGLANLDMQYYMSLAEQIKDIKISEGVKVISNHWNFINVNKMQIWGYRIYIYYLVVMIFKAPIWGVSTSIYLVSIFQILLGEYALLGIYNAMKDKFITYKKISLTLMLLAPSVWYGCVRLLRDCFMLLCISIAIKAIVKRKKFWSLKLVLAVAFLTILRPYYTVLLIPLLLIMISKDRLAVILNSGIFGVLCVICLMYNINIKTVIAVVLSPNFFNQVKILAIPAKVVAEQSGQIPIIGFIGSLWNFLIIFWIILNFIMDFKFDYKYICCLELILGVCMIYAITFGGSTELRHKMFFVVPFIIILNNEKYKVANKKRALTICLIVCFALALYTILSMVSY